MLHAEHDLRVFAEMAWTIVNGCFSTDRARNPDRRRTRRPRRSFLRERAAPAGTLRVRGQVDTHVAQRVRAHQRRDPGCRIGRADPGADGRVPLLRDNRRDCGYCIVASAAVGAKRKTARSHARFARRILPERGRRGPACGSGRRWRSRIGASLRQCDALRCGRLRARVGATNHGGASDGPDRTG